jgi:hypothetical protein
MANKKYTIRVDRKTVYTVLEHQLYKPKWINYFGSVEAVDEFKKNYKWT